jgi:hypothetical protein
MDLTGQYTRDRDKKRKKWIDCSLILEDSEKKIKVSELEGGKFVCKVSIDSAQLQMLREGEDVTIGYMIIRSDGQSAAVPASTIQNTVSTSTAVSTTATTVASHIPKPQVDPTGGHLVVSSSAHAQSSYATSSHISNEFDDESSQALPGKSTSFKKWKPPMAINADPDKPILSSRYGNTTNSSSRSIDPAMKCTDDFSQYFHLFSSSTSKPRVVCTSTFDSHLKYATHFHTALLEDMYLTIYNSMRQLEAICSNQSGKVINIGAICSHVGSNIYMSDGELIVSNSEENASTSKGGWAKPSRSNNAGDDDDFDSTDASNASPYNVNTKLYLSE